MGKQNGSLSVLFDCNPRTVTNNCVFLNQLLLSTPIMIMRSVVDFSYMQSRFKMLYKAKQSDYYLQHQESAKVKQGD